MSSYRCWILSKKGAEMTSAGVGVGQSSMQVLITGMIILRTPPPFPNTSLSLPTDLVLAFDPDWRSTPRGCTVSARYHVNSHTKATLCHFRFSRLQNPGVSTLVCGRGRFLVVALPPPRHSPPVVHLLPLSTVTRQEAECLHSRRPTNHTPPLTTHEKREFQQQPATMSSFGWR